MTPSRPEGAAPQGAKPPSAAALRAADRWFGGESEYMKDCLASLIDRETGLPELVEALRGLLEAYDEPLDDEAARAEAARIALRLAEQGREGR